MDKNMTKSVREKMMAKINARAKKLDAIKKKTSPKTYREYILDFITEMDEICLTAKDEIQFSIDIDSCAQMLIGRLRTVDPGIHAEIIWNCPEDWKDLRAIGVTIKWSKEYQKENPDAGEQEFVDVTDLLFM